MAFLLVLELSSCSRVVTVDVWRTDPLESVVGFYSRLAVMSWSTVLCCGCLQSRDRFLLPSCHRISAAVTSFAFTFIPHWIPFLIPCDLHCCCPIIFTFWKYRYIIQDQFAWKIYSKRNVAKEIITAESRILHYNPFPLDQMESWFMQDNERPYCNETLY